MPYLRKWLFTVAFAIIEFRLIVKYIGNNQSRFDKLFALFIENEKIIAQRAAFTVGHVFDIQPKLLEKHLPTLVKNMTTPNLHDAITRCTVRILQDTQLPKSLQGKAINECYKLLRDNKQPIAIRAFSIGAIHQISKNYPELQEELKLTLQDLLNHESPGLSGRSRNVSKLL